MLNENENQSHYNNLKTFINIKKHFILEEKYDKLRMRVVLNKGNMITLYDLNIDNIGKIHSLDTINESTLRLSQMGLVPGSIVRMIKKNPFGGPLELKLNDYYVAIRKEDAKMIQVEAL